MPHQCTNCERVFPDGSKEMLSGCPDCGGNKFQFRPAPADDPPTLGEDGDDADPPTDSSAPSADDPTPDTPSARSSGDPSPTPDTPSARPSGDPSPTSDAPAPPADGAASADEGAVPETSEGEFIEAECDPSVLDEDTAQSDARTDVVTRDELDRAAEPSPPDSAEDVARTVPPDSDESPGIEDLRAELNDQFESIKILEPGQYELNLMELYDRQECIISLREDGHYVIEVADSWRDDD